MAGTAAEGRVIAVGRTFDPQSATVSVRAQVTRGAAQLFANQPVEVELALSPGAGDTTWAIPAVALVRLRGGTVVFARGDKGFQPLPVRVVQEGREETLVTGLKGSEAIAVRGVSQLKSLAEGAP